MSPDLQSRPEILGVDRDGLYRVRAGKGTVIMRGKAENRATARPVQKSKGFTKVASASSAGASAGMVVLLLDPLAIGLAAAVFSATALLFGAWLVWVEREPSAES
jgi:fatty acid desaturase